MAQQHLCLKCNTYAVEAGKALCYTCTMAFINSPYNLSLKFPEMDSFPKGQPENGKPEPQ